MCWKRQGPAAHCWCSPPPAPPARVPPPCCAALSLKMRWKNFRKAKGLDTSKPNLVMGAQGEQGPERAGCRLEAGRRSGCGATHPRMPCMHALTIHLPPLLPLPSRPCLCSARVLAEVSRGERSRGAARAGGVPYRLAHREAGGARELARRCLMRAPCVPPPAGSAGTGTWRSATCLWRRGATCPRPSSCASEPSKGRRGEGSSSGRSITAASPHLYPLTFS